MHKKSVEAADKETDNDRESDDEHSRDATEPKYREDIRSESIASLRARALEHSAQLKNVISDQIKEPTKDFKHDGQFSESEKQLFLNRYPIEPINMANDNSRSQDEIEVV